MVLRQSRVTFGVLAAALLFSALYQLYRSALLEVPEYDAFTPMMGASHLVLIGISALVLTDRRWAWVEHLEIPEGALEVAHATRFDPP